jgi:hypothetical protein
MKYLLVVFAYVINMPTFAFSSDLQATQMPSDRSQYSEVTPCSTCMLSYRDDAMPDPIRNCCLGCGLVKRICGYPKPFHQHYYPEVYNYRHIYNIVGHDSFFSTSNFRCPCLTKRPPEEIPAPAAGQEDQLPRSIESARAVRTNAKKIQK